MAYYKILVPLDGSPIAEVALKQIDQIAAPGAAIHLLSVMSVDHITDVAMLASAAGQPFQPVDPNWPSYTQDIHAAEIEARHAYLSKTSQYLIDAGYQVTVQVKTHETISHVIADIARSGDYDVVIMVTHGRTGLNKLVLGSVTQAVLTNASCPVLVVPLSHTNNLAHRPTH